MTSAKELPLFAVTLRQKEQWDNALANKQPFKLFVNLYCAYTAILRVNLLDHELYIFIHDFPTIRFHVDGFVSPRFTREDTHQALTKEQVIERKRQEYISRIEEIHRLNKEYFDCLEVVYKSAKFLFEIVNESGIDLEKHMVLVLETYYTDDIDVE